MQLSYRDFATRQYEPTFIKNLIAWSISIQNNFAVELSTNYLWDIDDDLNCMQSFKVHGHLLQIHKND